MAETSLATEIEGPSTAVDVPPLQRPQPVSMDTLEKMTSVAQTILALARKNALAPNLTKSPPRYTLTEVSELVPMPRTTLDYAIQTKNLPKGEIEGRRRLFTLEDVEKLRKHAGTLPWRPPGTQPVIITIANNKGGIGKTSVTVHLAQYLAQKGYRTLAIDLDPQASLTVFFGLLPDSDVPDEATSLPFFRGDTDTLSTAVRRTHWHGLDLIPSNLSQSDVEFSLAARITHGDGFPFYRRLSDGLAGIGDNYDVIVIDTPPAQGFITLNALFAATGLLVPLTPAMLDFASVGTFMRMLTANMKVLSEYEGREKTLGFMRILFSKFEGNNKAHQQIERWVRKGFAGYVLAKNLALSSAVRTGPDMLTAYEASCDNAARSTDPRTLRRAVEFLDSVNEEVEALIREQWLPNSGDESLS
jgi:chromosome partitioning protein